MKKTEVTGWIVLNKFFCKLEGNDVFDTRAEAQAYANKQNKEYGAEHCLVARVVYE